MSCTFSIVKDFLFLPFSSSITPLVPIMCCNQLNNQEFLDLSNFVILIQPNMFLKQMRCSEVNGCQIVSATLMSKYQENGENQNEIVLHAT